jgi:hypothetical protein
MMQRQAINNANNVNPRPNYSQNGIVNSNQMLYNDNNGSQTGMR